MTEIIILAGPNGLFERRIKTRKKYKELKKQNPQKGQNICILEIIGCMLLKKDMSQQSLDPLINLSE